MSAGRRAPDTLPNALAWAEQAACRGQDPNLFFSEADLKVQQAKRICARCPVRTECLDEGLRAEDSSRYGIYGGLTPAERTELERDGGPGEHAVAAADPVSMYRAGASIRDIARHTGRSRSDIRGALLDAKVVLRSRGGDQMTAYRQKRSTKALP